MADPRADLKAAYSLLDEETQGGVVELARSLIEETLTATKGQLVKAVEIRCKDCNKLRIYDIPVQVPDVLTRLKGFEIIANQLQGSPATTTKIEVDVGARTLEELRLLSNEDLARIAGIDLSEEAEWEELQSSPKELESSSQPGS